MEYQKVNQHANLVIKVLHKPLKASCHGLCTSKGNLETPLQK